MTPPHLKLIHHRQEIFLFHLANHFDGIFQACFIRFYHYRFRSWWKAWRLVPPRWETWHLMTSCWQTFSVLYLVTATSRSTCVAGATWEESMRRTGCAAGETQQTLTRCPALITQPTHHRVGGRRPPSSAGVWAKRQIMNDEQLFKDISQISIFAELFTYIYFFFNTIFSLGGNWFL